MTDPGAVSLRPIQRRLTELAGDLMGTSRQVIELMARVDNAEAVAREHAGALSELLPRVDTVADLVVGLRGRVDALAEQLATAPPVATVCWPELDAEQAAPVWQALGDWIADVAGPVYRITRGELPDCWARHPDAVVELVWLHTCYREAYAPRARPSMAAEWHTRWRRDALTAVAEAIPARLCRPGQHLVPLREADAARSDARDARVQAAAAGGRSGAGGYQPPTPPAPAPTAGQHATDPATTQVIARAQWGPHFEQAMIEDLAARRARHGGG